MSVETKEATSGHERALQLARVTHMEEIPFNEVLKRIPKDWKEEEFDVDEFLDGLRGRDQREK